MRQYLLFPMLVIVIATPSAAQTMQKDVLLKHWKISGDFTIAVASAMPADGYTFRPTPEEMSFGELMAHIAALDRNACATASGLRVGAGYRESGSGQGDGNPIRKRLLRLLQCSYNGYAREPQPKRNMTGLEWLWSYFTHTAHHRGQAEVYLRLKGIKPPAYAF